MSRRKQAKPRAVFKSTDVEDDLANMGDCSVDQGENEGPGMLCESFCPSRDADDLSGRDSPSDSDTVGTRSWNSGDEEASSSSEPPGGELTFTIGPTETTPYACQFCEKAFPRLSYLKKHEQSHSDQMPFKCDFCQRLFKHKRSRDRHVKLHTGDKKYRCAHCESAFSRSDHLKIHLKTHDHQKPYQCGVCNRGYNTAAALTSHMQNHKKESLSGSPSPRQFRCLQCNNTFNSGEDLQGHVTSAHGTPERSKTPSASPHRPFLACIYCAKDFPSMEALQLHVHALHGPLLNGALPSPPQTSPQEALPCNFCTMKFPGLTALHKHVVAVHSFPTSFLQPKAKENAFCGPCAIAFPSGPAYAEHFLNFHLSPPKGPSSPPQVRPTDLSLKSDPRKLVESSSPPPPKKSKGEELSLLCNQCAAGFSDFESFRAHLRSHLEGSAEERFCCETCDSAFPSEAQLEAHSAAHFLATSTEYGCPTCLKRFPKPDELQKHLLDIHAHQLFRCAICSELGGRDLFDSKVSIQVHFAVKHSSEAKIFQCTACQQSFRSEIEFQLHVRHVHLRKSSSYRCLLCSSSFGSELELQFHLGTHQKQFQCKSCEEAFHVEFLLDKHVQKHHSLSLPNGSADQPAPRKNRKGGKKESRCDICDKAFPSDQEVLLHRKTVHHVTHESESEGEKKPKTVSSSPSASNSLSLSCAYCSENCKSRSDLEAHMKTHQSASSGKNKCNICDEVCPTATLLAEHKLTHCKVVSGSQCTGCKAGVSSEEEFLAHMRLHHGVPLTPPIPCLICRQTLLTEMEIGLHSRFHTQRGLEGEVPRQSSFQCCLCLRVEPARNGASEEGLKPFICEPCVERRGGPFPPAQLSPRTYQCIKCQLSFDSEEEVQTHVASHLSAEGTTHQQCFLCARAFDSPLKLQAHLIEHTFEGCSSFTCYMCSAVFTASAGLQHHMLEHGLQTRPYDCALCPLKFFFRGELENHRLSHVKLHPPLLSNGAPAKPKKFFYRSDDSDEDSASPEKPPSPAECAHKISPRPRQLEATN